MPKLREIFEDINGRLSSKRVIGILGVVTCIVLIVTSSISMVINKDYINNNTLIQWCVITFSGLIFGGSAVEFITKK